MFLKSRKLFKIGANYCVRRQNLYSTKKAVISPPSAEGILISDTCVQRLKELCSSNNFLRLSVESGGCSGFQYKFDLDDKIAEDDRVVARWKLQRADVRSAAARSLGYQTASIFVSPNSQAFSSENAHFVWGVIRIFERDGVRVIIDETSLDFIRGSTVDYHTELIRSAFRVDKNPKADVGCSCGASFSVKID